MKLQKYQIDHARCRLNTAMRARVAERVGTAPKAAYLTAEQKLNAIYAGKAKLIKRSEVNQHTDLIHAYEYDDPKHTAYLLAKKAWEANKELVEREERAAIERVIDNLVLSGDAAEALSMIDAYITGTPSKKKA